MKYKFLFITAVAVLISFGQVNAQKLSLDEISEKLAGSWELKKTEFAEKESGSNSYGFSKSVDDKNIVDYAGCYGNAVKALLFTTDSRADVECINNTSYKESGYHITELGDKYMLRIIHEPKEKEEKGMENHEQFMLEYWIEILNNNTIKISHEAFCQRESDGKMMKGMFTSILSKRE